MNSGARGRSWRSAYERLRTIAWSCLMPCVEADGLHRGGTRSWRALSPRHIVQALAWFSLSYIVVTSLLLLLSPWMGGPHEPSIDERPLHQHPFQLSRPTFSVIIPVYGQYEDLPRAVGSVVRALTKAYTPGPSPRGAMAVVHPGADPHSVPLPYLVEGAWEIIIVNDGSVDDGLSLQAAQTVRMRHPAHIRVLSQPNGGVSSARNLGIASAMGEWILCLDADDRVHFSLFQKVLGALVRAHPLSDSVVNMGKATGTMTRTSAEILVADPNVVAFGLRTEDDSFSWHPNRDLSKLRDENALHVSCLFKKELWEANGGFRSAFFFGWEDWDFWLRAHRRTGLRVLHIPDYLLIYRPGKRHHLCQLDEEHCQAFFASANCQYFPRATIEDAQIRIMESGLLSQDAKKNSPFHRALKRDARVEPELPFWNGLAREQAGEMAAAQRELQMALECTLEYLPPHYSLQTKAPLDSDEGKHWQCLVWQIQRALDRVSSTSVLPIPAPPVAPRLHVDLELTESVEVLSKEQIISYPSHCDRNIESGIVCSGRGSCEENGCQCDFPFAGTSCEVVVDSVLEKKAELPSVCFITKEFYGLSMGGIGTAVSNLALLLGMRGYKVTVLYATRNFNVDPGDTSFVTRSFDQRGVTVEMVANRRHDIKGPLPLVESWLAYDWLANNPGKCDVIHVHEWSGVGFHVANAVKSGLLHFPQMRFLVTLHGPWNWARRNQLLSVQTSLPPLIEHMEKVVVETADVVYSPSHWLAHHLSQEGWAVDEDEVRVIQNVVGQLSRSVVEGDGHVGQLVSVQGFAFFGKTDAFKGLPLFLDAIDGLVKDGQWRKGWELQFLVRSKHIFPGVDGIDYLKKRSSEWPSYVQDHVKIETELNTDQCMQRIKKERLVAVMPSLISENSPYVVLECLHSGLPFVATDVGGTSELIQRSHRSRVLCEPTADSLQGMLARIIDTKVSLVAGMQSTSIETNDEWYLQHMGRASDTDNSAGTTDTPRVGIVVICYKDFRFLGETVESIANLEYGGEVELSLVVNGIEDGAANVPGADHVRRILSGADDVNIVEVHVVYHARRLSYGEALDGAISRLSSAAEVLSFVEQGALLMRHHLYAVIAAMHRSGAELVSSDGWSSATADPQTDNDAELRLTAGGPLELGGVGNTFGTGTFTALASAWARIQCAGSSASGVWWDGEDGWDAEAAATIWSNYVLLVSHGATVLKFPEPTFFVRVPSATLSPHHKLQLRFLMQEHAMHLLRSSLSRSTVASMDLLRGLHERLLNEHELRSTDSAQWWVE